MFLKLNMTTNYSHLGPRSTTCLLPTVAATGISLIDKGMHGNHNQIWQAPSSLISHGADGAVLPLPFLSLPTVIVDMRFQKPLPSLNVAFGHVRTSFSRSDFDSRICRSIWDLCSIIRVLS